MNYTQLTQRIINWTEDDSTELSGVIDDIIDLAELRILKEANPMVARKTDTIALTGGSPAAPVPADIVTPRWVRIQSGATLLQKDESYIREFWPNPATTGVPRYYAWSGDGTSEFIVAPTPAVATTLEIGYTYRIAGLSSGNPTNWLSLNASDLLFYACMLEANAFLKMNEVDTRKFTELYERALQSFVAEDRQRRQTDSYRTGDRV